MLSCLWDDAYNRTLAANRKEEGSVLFNDALNTFYSQLYGVGGKSSPCGGSRFPLSLLSGPLPYV